MDQLLELWATWRSGETVSDQMLWTHTVLFWGRLGKFLQFVGALAVVAELIGAERLRRYGASLHRHINWHTAKAGLASARQYPKVIRRYLTAKGAEDQNLVLEEADKYPADKLNAVLMGLLLMVSGYELWLRYSIGKFLALFLLAFLAVGIFGVTIGPYMALAILFLAWSLGLVLDVFLFKPMAWALDRPAIDKLIQAGAVIFVAVGFHFDLLAS